MTNKLAVSEDQLEASITEYLAVTLPDDCVAFHIPNAGKRKSVAIAQMKRAGLLVGCPDRGVVWQGLIIFLEAKRPYIKGVQRAGLLSYEQIECHWQLRAAGAMVHVVHSLEEVESALIASGVPLRQRLFKTT